MRPMRHATCALASVSVTLQWPMSALGHSGHVGLFDHLISQKQKGFADRKTESSGRFEIDGELELIR